MDCTKCQECTKSFIDGTLPDNMIIEYYDHIEHCPSCKEDLVINYAIINALRSLNENRDLSSDFVKEVDDKLTASRNRIIHEAKAKRFRRIFAALEIICIMVFASVFPPIEKTYAFLPEESEDRIVLEINGVPSYMDPVLQAIYRYNSDVIRMLEEQKKAEREAKKKAAAEESDGAAGDAEKASDKASETSNKASGDSADASKDTTDGAGVTETKSSDSVPAGQNDKGEE